MMVFAVSVVSSANGSDVAGLAAGGAGGVCAKPACGTAKASIITHTVAVYDAKRSIFGSPQAASGAHRRLARPPKIASPRKTLARRNRSAALNLPQAAGGNTGADRFSPHISL